jgi:VanZ family protein
MISFLLSVHQSIRFVLVIVYIGCIAALSLLPPQDLPQVQLFEGADKVVHFLMYLFFSILGCWALKAEENRSGIWLTLPVTIGWGMLMELIQLEMHAGRSFSWYDILANSAGVVVGIIGYQLIVSKFAQRS